MFFIHICYTKQKEFKKKFIFSEKKGGLHQIWRRPPAVFLCLPSFLNERTRPAASFFLYILKAVFLNYPPLRPPTAQMIW